MSAKAVVDVTDNSKCYTYTFVCITCGLLAQAERSDAITCSPACRVAAHRSGASAKLRDIARKSEISPASIMRAAALDLLCPELAEGGWRGEIKIDDPATRRAMSRAFWAQLEAQLEAEGAA